MNLAAHPEMHGLANAMPSGAPPNSSPLHPDEAPSLLFCAENSEKQRVSSLLFDHAR
jgi:hypothetical protein